MIYEMKSWREKKLASFMKEMATSAKFNSQTLTNYSAKKDLVQKIRNENVTQTGGNFFINN